MSKQGYTITRVHKRNKIKADIKFRKASYNTFTNSKRAMTQSLSFNSEIVLNEATKYDLLFNLCKDYYIYKPSTFKCCLIQAVYTSVLLNKTKANYATKNYMKQFKDEEILESYNESIILYAHNGGKFDTALSLAETTIKNARRR